MSDNNRLDIDDLFVDEEESTDESGTGNDDMTSAPKPLRDYAKRQKQEKEELRQELAELRKEVREAKLNGLIEQKGLDPVVKDLIKDQDPEEWFQKYGHAFTANTTETNEGETEEGAGDEESTQGNRRQLTPEQRAQLQDTTSVQPGQTNLRTSGEPDLSSLDNAKSFDEAMELLAKQGLRAPNNSQT